MHKSVESAIDDADSEYLCIQNSFLRRALTLSALHTTAHFYKLPGIFTIIVSRWHIVKTGPFVHLSEAATMAFVSDNTSIPVPRVYCSFCHNKRAYIVMERIQGQPLHAVWDSASATTRHDLLLQLKGMLDELRALQPPDSGVASCMGGSLHDSRIPHCQGRFGPFKTIQDFHLWLRGGLSLASIDDKQDQQDWRDVKTMATRQDGSWPPPVFTHGDLNPFNILVRDGKIVSIIDWEFAGWYPAYWEYTSAWYGNRIRPNWQDVLKDFLTPFDEELQMEIIRQRWWGDF